MTDAQLDQAVAQAILGLDTLWGGDVMSASGTRRLIADSWFSGAGLPRPLSVTPKASPPGNPTASSSMPISLRSTWPARSPPCVNWRAGSPEPAAPFSRGSASACRSCGIWGWSAWTAATRCRTNGA